MSATPGSSSSPTSGVPQRLDEPRTEFLLEMYRQTSGHLNRHVLLLWQSVALLGGAYAAFAFQEKSVISVHHATAIALLLCGWFCATVYDAYAWFDRNLVIITNLEKLFLRESDLKFVHPYHASHRDPRKLVLLFEIQVVFGIAIATVVTVVHAMKHALPSLKIQNGVFDLHIALPYFSLAAAVAAVWWVRRDVFRKLEKLRADSPGICRAL